MEFYHEPIMLNEILEGLNFKSSDIFMDCTLGGAGHSSEVIKRIPKGLLIGIDKDKEALNYSEQRLKEFENKKLFNLDFKEFEKALFDLKIDKIDKILLDLGVSSHQIDTAKRGFSIRFDGPLDMRMDLGQERSAWHVVNFYPKPELVKILREYGEEKFANLIAGNICAHRKIKTVDTTQELKEIIEECLPKKYLYSSGGACKKTFQALRIEVNGELENLGKTLQKMIDRLSHGGRLAIMSFHSLEDRIVKNVFKENLTGCICPRGTPICVCGHTAKIKAVSHKPLMACDAEISRNNRAKSAKLRIIEKL